jgi:hypothetical protein
VRLTTSCYRSLSPVDVPLLVNGAKHVAIMGRVLSVSTRILVDAAASSTSLNILLYIMPCQSLHHASGTDSGTSGSNQPYHDSSSMCLVSCCVTANLTRSTADSNSSSMWSPVDDRRWKLLIKPGQQIFLGDLTAVACAEAGHADPSLLTLRLSNGITKVSKCFRLPPSALSSLMRLVPEYAAPGSPDLALHQKAVSAEGASSGLTSAMPPLNLSRIAALSTSPGVLPPVTVATLLSSGSGLHSSTWGCIAVCAAVGEGWSNELLDSVHMHQRGADQEGGGKRLRIAATDISEATQVCCIIKLPLLVSINRLTCCECR